MSRYKATIQERGNGLASEGEYVTEDGKVYRVVSTSGPIHTGRSGEGNYIHAIVEDADWDDVSDDDEPHCTAVVGKEVDEGVEPSMTRGTSHAVMKTTPYHVYAPDGFESAHRSLEAAERAARRGAKNRRMEYRVYLTSPSGFTGGGHGTLTYTAGPPKRR